MRVGNSEFKEEILSQGSGSKDVIQLSAHSLQNNLK